MMMLDESEHKHKLNTLLESGGMNPSPRILQLLVREHYRNSIQNIKYFCLPNLKHKLMPHHSKLLDILLRQIFSSISSACYTLVGFLRKFHFSTILK
jgi:hypothetical protein